MNARHPLKTRQVLAIVLLAVFGYLCFALIRMVETGNIPAERWGHFFSWRFPLVLVGSAAVLRTWILMGLTRNARRSCRMDLWTLGMIIPVYFLSSTRMGSEEFSCWTGLVFLAFLTWKSCILARHLLENLPLARSRRQFQVLFIGFVWFYASYAAWSVPAHEVGGDEPHYLLMTHSLIHDADLNLHDEYMNREYTGYYSGKLVPKPSDLNGPGFIRSRGLGASYSVLLIPGYLLFGYPGAVLMMIVWSSLLMTNTFFFYRKAVASERAALIAVLFLSISIPILIYSHLIYPDMIAALLLIIALRTVQIQPLTRKGRSVPFRLALISAILLLIKFRYIVVSALLLAAGTARMRRQGSRIILYAVTAAIIFSGYLAADKILFDGDMFLNRFGGIPQVRSYMPSWRSILVVPGLLFDQEAGFLWLAPLFFLVIPGIFTWRHEKGAVFWVSLMALPFTVIALLGHFAWHCLPTPPLRYMIPVLPAFCLFGAWTACRWDSMPVNGRITGQILAILTISFAWLHSLNPAWQVNMADGTGRIFESLGETIRVPVTSILPSFIRPSGVNICWLTGIAVACIFFAIRRRTSRSLHHDVNPSLSMLSICAVFTVLGWAGANLPLSRIEIEDRYLSQPSDGTFFPEKRDPFYHRETTYGWIFSNDDSMTPAFSLPPGKYHCTIRAKLMNHPFPCDLIIDRNGRSRGFITVTGIDWSIYALPVMVSQTPENTWKMRFKCPEGKHVAVDRITFYRTSDRIWSICRVSADLSRILRMPDLELLSLRTGFLRHPGDPWHAFRSHFNSNRLLPVPLPEADRYPIQSEDLIRVCDLAAGKEWQELIALERLYKFSAFSSVEPGQLREYYLGRVLHQSWLDLKPALTEMLRHHPDDQELRLSLVLLNFSNRNYAETLDGMETVVMDQWPIMTLSKPDRARLIAPGFTDQLAAMASDEMYQECVRDRLETRFRQALKAYLEHDIPRAAGFLFDCYRADTEVFRNLLLRLNRKQFTSILPEMPDLLIRDFLFLSESLISLRRYPEALMCATRALDMDPSRPCVRYAMARSLFHNLRFEEARRHCLIAIFMDFQDDNARHLLETILEAMHRHGIQLGSTAI
ncbi:tetratricopeptide repeat protein [bacterium]|nr:tetratricopeptide repeat protein [candidate division CSSED10-310 bacterium]